MAQKDRSTLKSFFETGDIPTEGNYTDLIDSSLSLAEGNTGNINLTGEITASGNISSSGTLTAESLSITNVVTTHVTASSISSSGELIASRILINEGNGIFFDDKFDDSVDPDFPQKITGQDNFIQVQADNFFNVVADETRFVTQSGTTQITFNHITGDISSSNSQSLFTISSASISHLQGNSPITIKDRTTFQSTVTASGNVSASGRVSSLGVTAVGAHSFFGSHDGEDKVFIERFSSTFPYAHIDCGGSDNNVEVGFRVDTRDNSGTLGAAFTIDGTAKEATFVGALNAPTLNTGQGDNELFDMDQNVTQNSTVTFAGITLAKVSKGGIGNFGDTISADGQSTTFTMNNIPSIPGKDDGKIGKSIPTFVRNSSVTQTSTIIVTCLTDQLSVTAFGNATATAVANAGYFISLGNEADTAFNVTSASFSALIF